MTCCSVHPKLMLTCPSLDALANLSLNTLILETRRHIKSLLYDAQRLFELTTGYKIFNHFTVCAKWLFSVIRRLVRQFKANALNLNQKAGVETNLNPFLVKFKSEL